MISCDKLRDTSPHEDDGVEVLEPLLDDGAEEAPLLASVGAFVPLPSFAQ